jgi:hypothetical protein
MDLIYWIFALVALIIAFLIATKKGIKFGKKKETSQE